MLEASDVIEMGKKLPEPRECTERTPLGGTRFELPEVIPQGERDTTLTRYAGQLRAHDATEDEVYKKLTEANERRCEPPLPDSDIRRITRSAMGFAPNEHATRGGNHKASASDGDEKPHKMPNTIHGVEGELRRLGYYDAIGYDELSNRITVVGDLPWKRGNDSEVWNDFDHARVMAEVQEANPRVTTGNVKDAIRNVSRDHSYNPLTRMLEQLPHWDGTPRAETLLERFFCVTPSTYEQEAFKLFMRGAIMRAYHPGIKFDYVPVLVSPREGIGKSTFVKLLCGDERYFLDDVSNIADKKTAGEEMRGKWIVELGEMKAVRSVPRDTANAFLTRTTDSYRPSYGHNSEDFPRSCVFFGTCNDLEWVDSIGDARRYLFIQCPDLPLSRYPLTHYNDHDMSNMRVYVAQAWAEMMVQYRACERRGEAFSLVLPESVRQDAMAARDEARPTDERAEAIRAYLEKQAEKPEATHRRQNVISVCEGALGMDRKEALKDKRTQSYVRQVLTRRGPSWGWEKEKNKQRMDGYNGTQRCWDYHGV